MACLGQTMLSSAPLGVDTSSMPFDPLSITSSSLGSSILQADAKINNVFLRKYVKAVFLNFLAF